MTLREILLPNPFSSSSEERRIVDGLIQNRRYELHEDIAYGAPIVANNHGPFETAEAENKPAPTNADSTANDKDPEEQFIAQVRDQEAELAKITDALRGVKAARGEYDELTQEEVKHAVEASVQKAQQFSTAPVEFQDGETIFLDADEALKQAYAAHSAPNDQLGLSA